MENAKQFTCVVCGNQLKKEECELVCQECGETYPLIAGKSIPILIPKDRMPNYVPDPGIPFSQALELSEKLYNTKGSFQDLVDAYYEFRRGSVEPSLFNYYRDVVKKRRVGSISDEVSAVSLALNCIQTSFPRINNVLEIGVGWGFSLAALGKNYRNTPYMANVHLFGFDLNPAILVIAQRLFAEFNLDNITLAVANAELPLPFAKKSMDFVFANSVIEHIPQQQNIMNNIAHVLSDNSVFYFSVPNRFMVHPEPHFNVRWVGFFPTQWQKWYIAKRLKIKTQYVEQIYSYSPSDLAKLLSPTFHNCLPIAIPVWAPESNIILRVISFFLKKLSVLYYHGIVYIDARSTDKEQLGKLHLTKIHGIGGNPLKIQRILNSK
jgi:SAM-dependent methyltransferase/uncharacterized protein YbaR (Trm112 family)